MARWKQARDEDQARARRELALHVASYAATQSATKALFYRTAGVRVPVLAQLAGAVTEGFLHAVIDDGRLLRKFSRLGSGRRRFVDEQGRALGRQQRFHDDVPGGRGQMDQAAHQQLQILAGVVVTVAVAALLAGGSAPPRASQAEVRRSGRVVRRDGAGRPGRPAVRGRGHRAWPSRG
jgi:hypothetical protein